jgi:hypothetical protein
LDSTVYDASTAVFWREILSAWWLLWQEDEREVEEDGEGSLYPRLGVD